VKPDEEITSAELHELVKVNDPRITFEGTIVEQKPAPHALPVAK
jgi:hypothetical protein